ncbi:Fe-S cluster assembly sulfur transfer protein SufU [Thalassomonas actiniarum]|uniref:SUF system NifU family Fe-S cluster assembly protein n=1 Tax=Thalassomonas actiniarum TaxID=485447 RepID=A0AAF0C481_9GAMM|nr:SUF system NifU family Fe-S cluster assembly protein [Thalassomonas actiniarum]WDE00358.1 SUF system NifU family Fe-S cluster assembly protein [Thalassomonas actiniarum]
MVTDKKQAMLYQQALLQHHKNPVGFNEAISFSHQARGSNAACGDEITLQLAYADDTIKAVAFSGDSCAICRASASILCQQLPGATAKQADEQMMDILAGLDGQQVFPQEAEALMAVSQYPVRKQCALLPWTALKEIIPQLLARTNTESNTESHAEENSENPQEKN